MNRWLKRAFVDESSNENPPEINEPTNGERKLPDEYLNTVKSVMGNEFNEDVTEESKQIFLNLQHQTKRERDQNINILMQNINNKKVEKVMVLANSNGTYCDYFQPLFNGVMFFTNHRIPFEGNGNTTQGSCFVYFGGNEKKFVEEFSQYGIVMKKVE